MNYFVLINGLVNLGAMVHSIYHGHPKWAVIWLCYGLASFMLCALEKGGH